MIKFVMCIRRHPDMTREQFQDYWMNKHGPYLYGECRRNEGHKIRAISYSGYPFERRPEKFERYVARI